MTSKICTSVTQSVKLVEVGIAVDTADMYYCFDDNIGKHTEYAQVIPKSELKPKEHFTLFPKDIPAWSLSALIDMLPDTIESGFWSLYTLYVCKTGVCYSAYYAESMQSLHRVGLYNGYFGENPDIKDLVDATFEMVVWLIGQKKDRMGGIN